MYLGQQGRQDSHILTASLGIGISGFTGRLAMENHWKLLSMEEGLVFKDHSGYSVKVGLERKQHWRQGDPLEHCCLSANE